MHKNKCQKYEKIGNCFSVNNRDEGFKMSHGNMDNSVDVASTTELLPNSVFESKEENSQRIE